MIARPSRKQSAYLGAGLLLLLASSPISGRLGRERIARGMTPGQEKAGVDPTTFVGTFVLAGFRPLAINYLWIKASTLQQSKEYWEVRSVYELLSKLQPNNPEVWVFNSWNMSYNISVEMAEAEDRWRWIKAGIDFARQGRRQNPTAEVIHNFEAQLFYQKIWDQPWLRGLVLQEYGKPDLQLALEAVERALARPHRAASCMWQRVILQRMAREALAAHGDVARARRLYAELRRTTAHILTHRQVKFYFDPPVVREELVEAAALYENQLFADLREHLRDLRGRERPPADWQARWRGAVGVLDQVARCHALIEAEIDATERAFRPALLEALATTTDPLQRLLLVGLGAHAGRWFADWRLFARTMREATLARRAWQPLVEQMYALPRNEQGRFRRERILPVLDRTFRRPLLEAANRIRTGDPNTTHLRGILRGWALSTRD